MKRLTITLLLTVATVTGCSLDPSQSRQINPDEEFSKLDGPAVETVEESLLRGAKEASAQGEYGKAMSLYRQLQDSSPDKLEYQIGLAESLRRVGDNQAAIVVYDLILSKDADHIDAMEGKALATMANGDMSAAGQQFKRVMEKDSKRWRTLNALGILFAVKDMKDEALAYFREADKNSANNPSVQNNMGLLQAMRNDFNEATQTLQKASRLAQGNHRKQIDLNLALVHGISGNMPAARKVAEQYLSGAALTNNLGLYAHLSNDDELAKSYLNMALSGSTTYYERAWKNLDIISNESKTQADIVPGQKSIKVE